MGFVWASALKDLRRHRRDPLAFGLAVGIPLAIGLVLTLVSGGPGGGTKIEATLLVADHDGSFLSRAVTAAFGQGRLAELVRVEPVEEAAGRARMARGRASALLIIREGFGGAVLREEPDTLTLITNPAQRILPGIIEETLSILTDGAFYLHRLVGDDLRELAEGPPAGADVMPDSMIAAFSVKVNGLVTRLRKYLFPPAIRVETAAAAADEEQMDWSAAFFPGLLFMALFFVAEGLGSDVWLERDRGTLRRALASPERASAFLAGKLLAGAVLILGVSLAALLAGRWLFGLALHNLPLAALWAAFAGSALTAMMVLVQLLASSQRAGSLLANVLMFPLLMAGGSFFPFEAMPEWMAAVGRRTPNGWALAELKAILTGPIEPAHLGVAFAGLLAAGTVFFLLAARRLRRGFAAG